MKDDLVVNFYLVLQAKKNGLCCKNAIAVNFAAFIRRQFSVLMYYLFKSSTSTKLKQKIKTGIQKIHVLNLQLYSHL